MKSALGLFLVGFLWPALSARSQAEDPKWSQLPFEGLGAMNIYSYKYGEENIVLADDWQCTSPRPVTRIRWWGSYPDWMEEIPAGPVPFPPVRPVAFILSWHEYTHPEEGHSQPAALIREEFCETFSELYWGADPRWDNPGYYEHEFVYEQVLSEPWVQTEGYYYFLNIQAVFPLEPEPYYFWGWKNTHPAFHWNDDAVRGTDGVYWEELFYPPGHPEYPLSIDMAFELYVDPATPTPSPSPSAGKPTPTVPHEITPPPTATPTPSPAKTCTPWGPGTPSTTPTPRRTPSPTPTPTCTVGSPTAPPTPRRAVSGDYSGDSTADIALFRPSAGRWLIRNLTKPYFGASGDTPVPEDYSGSGAWEIAVFRPSLGKWLVRGVTSAFYGFSTDVPVPAAYSGPSAAIAVFRPAKGKWLIRGGSSVYYGAASDLTVPADYDGDGSADIAVFRPSIGKWLIRGVTGAFYGFSTDVLAPADYDGDGSCDIAVFRPATGRWLVRGGASAYYGTSTDTPQPADYNGDGSADFGLYRSSLGKWLVRNVTQVYYGAATDIPVTCP